METSRKRAAEDKCYIYHQANSKRYKNKTFVSKIRPFRHRRVKNKLESIPALHGKMILSASYGWLVLYDPDTKRISLTRERDFITIDDLPPLEESSNSNFETCVLTSSPDDRSQCKLLLFPDYDIKTQSIFCCQLSDTSCWSELRYDDQIDSYLFSGAISHAHAGKVYAKLMDPDNWNECEHFLWSIEIVVDVEKPIGLGLELSRVAILPTSMWNRPHLSWHHVHECMVACYDGLFSVQFSWATEKVREPLGIEVARLNMDTMVWEDVKHLWDRSFFISSEYSAGCHVPWEGCVYFNFSANVGQKSIYGDYESLYCYCIKDESLSESLLLPSSPKTHLFPSRLWTRPEDYCIGDEEEKRRTLSDLPFDVLQEVTKHLITFDYLNFREVSRICRSVAPPKEWRRRTLLSSKVEETSTLSPFPLLMVARNDQSTYEFIDPRVPHDYDSNYTIRMPKGLRDASICYSNQGWLVLSKEERIYLYNPFTRDILQYPLSYGSDLNFIFAHEKGGSFRLICISFVDRDWIHVSSYNPESREWIYVSHMGNNHKKFEATQNSGVFFQDAFYYLDHNGNLGKFKLDITGLEQDQGRGCSWEVLDEPRRPTTCSSFNQNFLVECGGELLSVFLGPGGKGVDVYKLNRSKPVWSWETVTDLGNYVLYLSRFSTFSVEAKESPCGTNLCNVIYFPRLLRNKIVFYSLATGMWHFSLNEGHVENPYSSYDFSDTKLKMNACWITPSWSAL